jgi:hypothetical protein
MEIQKQQKRTEKINKFNTENEKIINYIDKIVLFKDNIYLIKEYSSLYIYGYKYKINKEVILNNDVVYYTIGQSISYKSFLDVKETNKTKIKRSEFVCAIEFNEIKIIEDNKINDIYLKINLEYSRCNNIEILYNYLDSKFKNNEEYVIDKHKLGILLQNYDACIHFGQNNNQFYLTNAEKYKQQIVNYIKFLKIKNYNIDKLLNELEQEEIRIKYKTIYTNVLINNEVSLHIQLERADDVKDWQEFKRILNQDKDFLLFHIEQTKDIFEYNFLKLPIEQQQELFN